MIAFLLAFAATLLGGMVFPWWWPALVGLSLGLWLRGTNARIFSTAVLSAGLAWGLAAAFQQILNHGLLAGKVASIFHLPGGWCLALLTALVGGLTACLGMWLGQSLRQLGKSNF